MKIIEAADRQKKVGGSIDSWCGKCKLVLVHTIEAMIGDKPARVHCNTCNAQHSYKPKAPTISTDAKPRASRYDKLLKENKTVARKYSGTERYAAGDVMQHALFGVGVTTAVKDGGKVEVLFDSGPKLLVHDRA
jgi:hypothetical protein